MKRITQSSMNFKCQVGLMKVVTYQFISKSPAEVNSKLFLKARLTVSFP